MSKEEKEETVEEVQAEEETHELSQAAVIDFDALFKPITKKEPAGNYLRYDGVYDEIGDARRADDTLERGDWQGELKVADFRSVIELAVPVLQNKSKDMQIAAWLSEALVKVHGFVGLRDSLRLLTGLQASFWETIFPEIEDGDMEGRANAVAWFDKEAAFAVKQASITADGRSFLDWQDSKKFDIPNDLDMLDSEERQKFTALKEQAEKQNRTTADQWKKAAARSKRAFYEELNVAIEECWEEHKKLNILIEEKFDPKQAPGLGNLKKSLDKIQIQTDKLLKQKRIEEPDPIEEDEEMTDGGGAESSEAGNRSSLGSTKGAIESRKDALRRLTALASYFHKTEPHSPVSYLINRAVKWGEMPLESWLQDVIKDENILYQLRQTLGFNTAATDGPEPAPVSDPTPVIDPTAVE